MHILSFHNFFSPITCFRCLGLWGWGGGVVLFKEWRGAGCRFPGQQGHSEGPGPFSTHNLPQLCCGVQLWPDGDSVLPSAPGLHLPTADPCEWTSPGSQGATDEGWLRGKHSNVCIYFILIIITIIFRVFQDLTPIFGGLILINSFAFLCCVDHSNGRPARFREDDMGEEPCPGEPWEILHPGQRHHCGQDDGQYWYSCVVSWWLFMVAL